MTFEDDFVEIRFQTGTRRYSCRGLGIHWPPPSEFSFYEFVLRRVSISDLSDAQRADMTRVARGALYEVVG